MPIPAFGPILQLRCLYRASRLYCSFAAYTAPRAYTGLRPYTAASLPIPPPPPFAMWFVLNYVPVSLAKSRLSAACWIDRFNTSEDNPLELFAPTFFTFTKKNGVKTPVEKPLTFHYVFVKGEFEDVKKLCAQENGFSFVLDRSAVSRHAVIHDTDMEIFRRMAGAWSNRLPYYPLEDVNLEEGDKVEIVEGDFPGLKGYYFPNRKSASGNIVLQITQNLGTVVYDVKAKYIRVLEFARDSKRAYDIIDAYLPVLFDAMQNYRENRQLTAKEAADLSIFSRRMTGCKMENHKLQAKLAALLMTTEYLLGNSQREETARKLLEKRISAVTSPVTKSLILLLQSYVEANPETYTQGHTLLSSVDKTSRSLTLLREAYASLTPNT